MRPVEQERLSLQRHCMSLGGVGEGSIAGGGWGGDLSALDPFGQGTGSGLQASQPPVCPPPLPQATRPPRAWGHPAC